MRLFLASASPRRAELLRAAGFIFDVAPVHLDERMKYGEAPEQYVARLAEAKAAAARVDLDKSGLQTNEETVVLGADTTVVVRGEVLGKPVDEADAARMLRLLSNRTHQVLTAICLQTATRSLVHVEPTQVRLSAMSEAEISWYIATGEPRDKAGGYAVQGLASRFIETVEGSYSSVVGLPVASLYSLLKQLGCDILIP